MIVSVGDLRCIRFLVVRGKAGWGLSIFVMIIGIWVSVAILFIIRIYAFHELNAGLEDIMGCAGAVVASIGVCMVSYISKKGF